MARQKYPSDYRRWFKVYEDILDNAKLEDAPADVFRFYILLLAMLKRTNSNTGSIRLSRLAMRRLSGRSQLPSALLVATSGVAAGLFSMEEHDGYTVITVPNWLEKQGIPPADLRGSSGSTPGSRVEKSRVEKSIKETANGADAPAPRIDGFVSMLKGQVPVGRGGETWDSPRDWLGAHKDRLVPLAQLKADENDGEQFRRAFIAVMLSWWANKTPPATGNGADPKPTHAERLSEEADALRLKLGIPEEPDAKRPH